MVQIDIDYSGRPNKSLVRWRILTLVEELFQPEHTPDEKLAYVSFSGYQWLDCLEFYKRFGIRRIYSIEKSTRKYKRALFNRPYEFFDLFLGEVPQFIDDQLAEISKARKVIYLDYESRFSDPVLRDLEAIFASHFFDREGILFLTFNTAFQRRKLSPLMDDTIPAEIQSRNRFEKWLAEEFSGYLLNLLQSRYERGKLLREVLKVFYEDTARMVVLGYLVQSNAEDVVRVERCNREDFHLPHLTFLERNFIYNNLGKEPEKIADEVGVPEKFVESVMRYA